ncbi:EamA family transporter RarD [Roseofilum casamattae]|uniref:EamA family transporter RarD n=1 Tax=Roseofilum casamattae BLCC-M143 TaxID=3022442 RepID=A0ABT7C0D6_9CYAN|nr:EamA family transporter RarD [Roseofilum casamattae]MDJ1184919.1 EamA family transporter RarD [Roseofilum casamattae BLCC-M143]
MRSLPRFNLGLLYAVLAYGWWGFLPIYLKFFTSIPAIEVLCHRVVWSAVLLLSILWIQGQLIEFKKLWRSPKTWLILLFTATLLSANWGIYIYGVNTDRVLEASLGYFINPLFSVLLGFVVLRERLNLWQILAVFVATLGVGNLIVQFGQIPWIALGLTFTFGLYGLTRKMAALKPIPGLAGETVLMAPIALAFLAHGFTTGTGNFGRNIVLDLLFIGCGVVTSMPLIWFNQAAQRLHLSTLGLMQYIGPSLQLALAVFLYREPFTKTHAISFGLIWTALAIYSINSLWQVMGSGDRSPMARRG